MTMLDRALHWLASGYHLVPIQPGSKWIVKGFGAYLQHVTTEDQARFWFGERHANVGLVIAGGLVVLDFDDLAMYARWTAIAGELADTYTERTRHGMHVLMCGQVESWPGIAVELKRSGVVLLAPSAIGGFVYQVHQDHAIKVMESAPPSLSLLSNEHSLSLSTGEDDGDLVSAIKLAFPILAMASGLTKLQTTNGRWYHGRCPFHDDHSPSFWVDIERGMWGCYVCGTGDVINLVAKSKAITVQQAINELAQELRG